MKVPLPRFLIAGRLTRDYIILPSGKTLLDVPGGNALYAGVGLLVLAWVATVVEHQDQNDRNDG